MWGGSICDFRGGEGARRATLFAVWQIQAEPFHDPLQGGKLKNVPSLRRHFDAVQSINVQLGRLQAFAGQHLHRPPLVDSQVPLSQSTIIRKRFRAA